MSRRWGAAGEGRRRFGSGSCISCDFTCQGSGVSGLCRLWGVLGTEGSSPSLPFHPHQALLLGAPTRRTTIPLPSSPLMGARGGTAGDNPASRALWSLRSAGPQASPLPHLLPGKLQQGLSPAPPTPGPLASAGASPGALPRASRPPLGMCKCNQLPSQQRLRSVGSTYLNDDKTHVRHLGSLPLTNCLFPGRPGWTPTLRLSTAPRGKCSHGNPATKPSSLL